MALSYTVVGPVTKRVTRNINKPVKDPKPQKGGVSAFENAIADLSPLAWYRFREPNFNARVKDSTANGYHLTKQLAAATRSAVATRTTHPGGAYFPAVTYDNWASQGTFYKGTTGLLSGATEYTMLISYRVIQAPSANAGKLFGIGTENVAETSDNDLAFMRVANNAPSNQHYFKHRTNSPGLVPVNYAVTEVLQDGVNRLAIVRYNRATPVYVLTTSKPGHVNLTEESPAATSGTGLQAISRALILNTRSEATAGSSTTTGVVIDQIAVFSTDIGSTAATDLHTKWSAELGGYYPSMMQYDGSTGYYSKTGITVSGNKTTLFGRFRVSTFATSYKWVGGVDGSTRSRGEVAVGPTDAATADERGKLVCFVFNSAGTQICRLISTSSINDDQEHCFLFAFDGDAGTAVLYIDGVNEDNASASSRVAPTAGTLQTGASGRCAVGRNPGLGATTNWPGYIGAFGHREAYLTNYADFMDGSSLLPIDEKDWTEWGAQPLFWSHTGQLSNNKGSAGDMTATGTITMTTGGSP